MSLRLSLYELGFSSSQPGFAHHDLTLQQAQKHVDVQGMSPTESDVTTDLSAVSSMEIKKKKVDIPKL